VTVLWPSPPLSVNQSLLPLPFPLSLNLSWNLFLCLKKKKPLWLHFYFSPNHVFWNSIHPLRFDAKDFSWIQLLISLPSGHIYTLFLLLKSDVNFNPSNHWENVTCSYNSTVLHDTPHLI
jgi:hypothetical protein